MQRQVDAIDIYSTDAKIRQYGLRVLDDDKHYFPRYDAVLLYRLDLPQRLPKAWQALGALEGSDQGRRHDRDECGGGAGGAPVRGDCARLAGVGRAGSPRVQA
jgi:hypothetical protein